MVFWDVLFIAQDLDVSPDEAVCDALSAVDVGSFHDYAVLHLRVEDGGAVSDAGVGADVCLGADGAVFSYYRWSL